VSQKTAEAQVKFCQKVNANGQLSKEGPYREWHLENLKLMVMGQFFNDQKVGQWNGWFASGTHEFEVNYRDGLRDGSVKMWFETGKVNFTSFWKKGFVEGESRQYSPEGKLQSIIHYKEGKTHGLVQHFSEKTGQKIYQAEFVENKVMGTYYEWYEDGTLAVEANQDAQGNLHGLYKAWWPNKKQKTQIQYEHGKIIQPKLQWDEVGKPKK
jgi:antitoxin component YwqK of YwqJK toxin-antitoxin module